MKPRPALFPANASGRTVPNHPTRVKRPTLRQPGRGANTSAVSNRLLSGNTYQFRMQAKNQAGNWSEWVKGPTFVVSDYQETSNAIAYL